MKPTDYGMNDPRSRQLFRNASRTAKPRRSGQLVTLRAEKPQEKAVHVSSGSQRTMNSRGSPLQQHQQTERRPHFS